MTGLLRSVKDAVKQTPLWPILRPRRIHVYGVGAPKTGTVSLARLFGNYRTGHEAHPDQSADIVAAGAKGKELRDCVRKRDHRWRLECEVGYFLVYFVEALATEFPDATFICTVRPPRSWLRSIIDQTINNSREDLPGGYLCLRDYSFGEIPGRYPEQERPLAENELHTLNGYLSYWAFHYRRVLDALPPDRRLFLRTQELTEAADRIADFVGVPESSLQAERAHAHRTSEKHGLLNEIEESYVQSMISTHCEEIMNRLTQETPITLQ